MSIQGLDRLLRKLNALGGNSKKALKRGISKAARLVQGDAKDLCQVDTGRLRNSIKSSVKEERGKIIGKVGTNVEYAAYVEFGTGQRGKAADIEAKDKINLSYREDWAGMKPQPYLYPALKQNEKKIKKIVKDELKKEIRRVAK
ncbi:HK97-gp10 family putative phage morphogenesis protein [Caminicella sporogenes]|uniref:HK97-gp10 family putative phage morphogenesis protein n=1 Tax=Caminicella sporogenes TaxID=166485 RepID=UPI0025405909|nr:HK97-gp10 family putative phage morphogenesis protein [Caminicella sporogenes]WIF95017.1 HK97 gp10 family phage protein [Caminicella sporogenes]